MTQTTIAIDEKVCILLAAYAEKRGVMSLSDMICCLLNEANAAARLLQATLGDKGGTALSQSSPLHRPVSGKLEIQYNPPGEENFKRALLKRKIAYVRLTFVDGKMETKLWRADGFSPSSSVINNLRSGYLRGWRKRGICKAEVSIAPIGETAADISRTTPQDENRLSALDVQLRTAGKKTFVRCFAKAHNRRGDITTDQVAECDPDSAEWKDESLATKTSVIRAIFRKGNQCAALKMCFTIRGNSATETQARQLHEKFCQRHG